MNYKQEKKKNQVQKRIKQRKEREVPAVTEEQKINRSLYRLGWWAGGLLLVCGVLLKVLHINLSNYLLPCLLWNGFGYYCPGCGGTRAVKALLSGNILRSLYYHPIVLYGAVVYGWFIISNTIELISKGRLAVGMKYRDIYLWIAAVLVVGHFIVRNILLHIFGIAM